MFVGLWFGVGMIVTAMLYAMRKMRVSRLKVSKQ